MSLLHDPVELTEAYLAVVDAVDREARAEALEISGGREGSIHAFWMCKRVILAAHGVEWRSPQAMNPNVLFD